MHLVPDYDYAKGALTMSGRSPQWMTTVTANAGASENQGPANGAIPVNRDSDSVITPISAASGERRRVHRSGDHPSSGSVRRAD